MAGGRRVAFGHVARGKSKNPIVPFSFLFINRKSRQTGHYGETWKHPIPFRPRYVESSCAICTEIVRETWSKPGEEMKISTIRAGLKRIWSGVEELVDSLGSWSKDCRFESCPRLVNIDMSWMHTYSSSKVVSVQMCSSSSKHGSICLASSHHLSVMKK